MLIQFWHFKKYDYEKELYEPIKNNHLRKNHEIILPYDGAPINSKDTLQKADIFFAEVSYPSTGLWIELWFASMYWTKIVCFCKEGTELPWSLKYVCDDFFEYTNSVNMMNQINTRIETNN